MLNSLRRPFTSKTAPVGSEVSRVFPWWSTAYQEVTDNNAIYDKFVFRAPQGNRQAFANDKPWPVYIDEIRFWTTEEPETTETVLRYEGAMERTCFRIKTDLQGQIINKWMPGICYNTEVDRHLYGYQNSMIWTLPAPYYLPHGNLFSIELESPYVDWTEESIQCALRGFDPNNEVPIAIVTETAELPDYTATPTPGRLVRAFDDQRDRPVKDAWLQDFTATMISLPDTQRPPWERINAKFNVPEGPLWTNDITTPLIALCDQVQGPDYSSLYYAPVIHRPPSPYILRPGDSMEIEMQVRYDPNAIYVSDHRVWAHVRGWQQGEGI